MFAGLQRDRKENSVCLTGCNSLAHCCRSTLLILSHICLPYTALYRTCSLIFNVYVVILTLLNLCLVQGGVGEGGGKIGQGGIKKKVL